MSERADRLLALLPDAGIDVLLDAPGRPRPGCVIEPSEVLAAVRELAA